MKPVVILSATRTPIGAFQGALSSIAAPKLAAAAIKGALAAAKVKPEEISDVLMGNVLQAGQGQAPARQAAIYAGLPASARTVTVNKVCGSALQAMMQATHALNAGMGTCYVAGGTENMSMSPYLLPKAREGFRLGHQQVVDSMITDGLWDPYNDQHMGRCAEQCATRYGFSREQQDAYAIESFTRARAAQGDGRVADELTPVEFTDAKGNVTSFSSDEGPAKVKFDKVPTLKPSFQKEGTITAANASSLADGASALLLCSEDLASMRGWTPLARIVSFGAHADDPLWFTTAPVQATQRALNAAGWSVDDVDLWEVNEAFAVVPLAFMKELNVAHDRLNVRGGAIALGHPLGCSGARIVVTLLAALRERGLKRGVAAICIGGGEGLAVCVERL
ncbi:MAG: thiolase family protein [Opitutus sp.]